MIERTAWRPQIEHPPVRVIRATGLALQRGITRHKIEGVPVRVTVPAKTVADCFKYRSKVGTDVAIEAYYATAGGSGRRRWMRSIATRRSIAWPT